MPTETDRVSYQDALADAHVRSEASHRFAERWIPILTVVTYGSLLIGAIVAFIYWPPNL